MNSEAVAISAADGVGGYEQKGADAGQESASPTGPGVGTANAAGGGMAH